MVDRNARAQLAEALRSYVDEKGTAFELDTAMGKVQTQDRTARKIRLWLWFHYDDVRDHKIVASKAQWDYFNRLLLLLASDAEIEIKKKPRRWHICQAFAASGVACFACLLFCVGVRGQLYFCALPFGAVSMAIKWFNSRRRKVERVSGVDGLAPFPSFGSLRAVRRSVLGFTRASYPSPIAQRRIRSPILHYVFWIPWVLIWLVCGPLVLLVQALPESDAALEISVPEPRSIGPRQSPV